MMRGASLSSLIRARFSVTPTDIIGCHIFWAVSGRGRGRHGLLDTVIRPPVGGRDGEGAAGPHPAEAAR